MNILAWLALWIVCAVGLAVVWAGLHSPSRLQGSSTPDGPDAVTHCRLCGPTAAAIKRSGFCWRCEPHVKVARLNYGHSERA